MPRIVDLGLRLPQPVVNENTGEITHYATDLPEIFAEPSADRWAAARAAQAADPSGLPWLPYSPAYTYRTATGPTEYDPYAGEVQGPGFPRYLVKFDARPGAADFFKLDEAGATDAIKRAGGNPSLEYMTARNEDPKGNKDHDFLRTLYVREGDLWRPLTAYHFYEASSWVQFRDADLIPIASVALAVWGGALAQSIGKAVVGTQLAASYPALPGLVGNVALQTAANGGDIAAAVQNAALGMVGAQAGNLVGGGAIGAATSAATTAALKGGDLSSAVASSLLSYGAKNVDFDSFFSGASATGADNMALDVQSFQPTASQVTAFDYGAAMASDYGPPEPASWQQVDWSQVTPQNDYTTDRATWAIDNPMYGGVDYGGDTSTPAPAAGSGSSDAIVTLTNAALALIKVNAAYQASQQPQPRTAVQSGGYVKTPNPNGTITVRNTQTGQTQVTKPEVGAPYVLTNGSTIINNGNGTFTTIRPDGTSITTAYAPAGTSSAGVPPALLYAGLGLGALLLLRR